jgi:alpha-1,2-mannosyltransferase
VRSRRVIALVPAAPILEWNAVLRLRDRTRLALVAVLAPAVAVMAVVTIVAAAMGGIAGDFRGAFLPAAEAIVDGGSPYAVAGYVYPPQLAFVLTPLTIVPHDVAALAALAACAGLLIATLAVLGVRDPLCYLAMFAWTPTWNELDMAGVTPALALGLALAWRYRDRKWPPAIALALAVSTKVFLWPMFVWSLATRRTRLAVLAAGAGLAITAALWFVLGFDGLVDYPERLRDISASESIRRDSLSFVGLATTLGLGVVVGHAMMLVAGISLLVGSVVRGRRGDDRAAFCLALAAAVAMTPILWLHYLLLLMVPLAITRPRFTPLWLLPLVLWMGPEPMHPEGPLASLPMLVVGLIVALVVSDGWHFRLHRPLLAQPDTEDA